MLEVINTKVEFNKESKISSSESNDCVVRAIASSFEISYDDAHEFSKNKFAREDNKGTLNFVPKISLIKKAFGKSITPLGEIWKEDLGVNFYVGKRLFKGRSNRPSRNFCVINYTTNSFIKDYPLGTYLVVVSGHAFTIKDGIIYGNNSDSRKIKSRLHNVFKIENIG